MTVISPMQSAVPLISFLVGVVSADEARVAVKHPHCRLFLAESTIPNAGLGIFSGIDLANGDAVAEPDILVPFPDHAWHTEGDLDFWLLWAEYSWHPSQMGLQFDMVDGSAIVIGTGCMPNCNFANLNAREDHHPDYDHAGLHRSTDPGTSGFTGWHNQKMFATKDIPAGGEIFVDYGYPWFDDRVDSVGAVPYEKHFKRSDKLLRKLKVKCLKYQTSQNSAFCRDLWEVVEALAVFDTRSGNAIPFSFDDVKTAMTAGSAMSRLPHSIRTLEWLSEHGRCMDNIRPAQSTIKQAGRGAFAARMIPKGGLVAPGPLLHIPNRTAFNMYGVGEDGHRDADNLVGMQLILNYCFGHRESTVLLCPYTSPSAYINHSSEPNAKVVWSDDSTPNHNSFWLDENVNFLKSMSTIGLSIDFVATRDIVPGEEVFIDYGREWEIAWDDHVRNWSPPPGSEEFMSASVLGKDHSTPLRTREEEGSDPYPENFVFYCHYGYQPGMPEGIFEWLDVWANLTIVPCDIIERHAGVDAYGTSAYFYTVIMNSEDDLEGELYIPPEEEHILVNVPRWAISVQDERYAKDEFQENSFRHAMMMPDEIFPETWTDHHGNINDS